MQTSKQNVLTPVFWIGSIIPTTGERYEHLH
jgi:hypothetical protein